jgi:hypothetical protein
VIGIVHGRTSESVYLTMCGCASVFVSQLFLYACTFGVSIATGVDVAFYIRDCFGFSGFKPRVMRRWMMDRQTMVKMVILLAEVSIIYDKLVFSEVWMEFCVA